MLHETQTRRAFIRAATLSTATLLGGIKAQGASELVQVVADEAAKRVDVLVNGQPFTSYLWAENLKKPVLYPLRTANGTIVTRGFPLVSRAGESVDHPHQIGFWLNYGDVNGLDFWNNSTARTPAELAGMGTIAHRRVIKTKNGGPTGKLQVEMAWLRPDATTILREKTTFIFHAAKNLRMIDRITELTALEQQVVFRDSKEGLLGLRVRRELEQPTNTPIILTAADGRPGVKPLIDNTGVTGQFRNSEGKIGDEVWGTRGRWATLAGKVGAESILLAILDHKHNVGFPTYWMTRGYGLFAANPLGQKVFSIEKKEAQARTLNFTLEPTKSVIFRYRLLIYTGVVTAAQIEGQYGDFTKKAA